MAEKSAVRPREREEHGLARRGTLGSPVDSPFRMLEQFADEMDRLFDDFGLNRFGLTRSMRSPLRTGDYDIWSPPIEVTQRNNELLVRADLPGVNKEDVKVDVSDDAVTIHGERRREHQEEEGGLLRSERTYGSFTRTIPLPEGAITDQAKATFKNGVLEVTVPAPPDQVRRGRRLEITEGSK